MGTMEKLANLPTKDDTPSSPEQEAIMNHFFGEPPEEKGFVEKIQLKKVAIFTLLFVALTNPLTDTILSKIPYLSNSYVLLGVKTFAFFVLMLLLNWLF